MASVHLSVPAWAHSGKLLLLWARLAGYINRLLLQQRM